MSPYLFYPLLIIVSSLLTGLILTWLFPWRRL